MQLLNSATLVMAPTTTLYIHERSSTILQIGDSIHHSRGQRQLLKPSTHRPITITQKYKQGYPLQASSCNNGGKCIKQGVVVDAGMILVVFIEFRYISNLQAATLEVKYEMETSRDGGLMRNLAKRRGRRRTGQRQQLSYRRGRRAKTTDLQKRQE